MAFFNKRYHPAGTAPGTLTREIPGDAEPLRIRLIDYDKTVFSVHDNLTAQECGPYLASDTVTWIHVEGHPSEAMLRELGGSFNLHNLALEDVLNTGQRPKVEPFDDQLFIVVSLPMMVDELVEVRQLSLFLHERFVISFWESDFSPFQPIVKRLQDKKGRLRNRGADFLLYCLLDLAIDQGYPVLESFGQQLEDLEEQILYNADRATLAHIHTVKRELILLRRMVWPHREVINQLLRDESALVRESTLVYLRDCYDHTVQVMDLLETYREMASSMLEIYLSSVSNRMNDVMRVLTVIATIFIPLTFVVGIYGMNFDRSAGSLSMPELGQPYGYVIVWLVMIAIAGSMVAWFRYRKWF